MLSGVKQEHLDLHTLNQPLIADVRARLQSQQKYIRGLFCGGTLCDETLFAVMEKHGDVYSNIQPDPEFRLQDINRSIKHTFLDFGDDDFTNGKPHPMIDPTNRISRLIEEARDPEVAVIVRVEFYSQHSICSRRAIVNRYASGYRKVRWQQGIVGRDLSRPGVMLDEIWLR